MADQLIPLTTQPHQTFDVALAVDGNTLRLSLAIDYNEMAAYWTLGVKDSSGTPLLASVPLVTGTWPAANVLEQFAYLKIGAAYVLNVSQSLLDYPDAASLGTAFALLWGDTP